MKRTLLVLALLLTTELGFQTEACPVFYEVFAALALGSRKLLYISLNKPNATEAEKAALGKIQDCYNEGGMNAKILDAQAMSAITFSGECTPFYGAEMMEKLTEILSLVSFISNLLRS